MVTTSLWGFFQVLISNTFDILKWLSLLSANMKKIQSKMKALEPYSAVRGHIWPNFELIPAFMHAIITCKNEKNPIKSEGARSVAMETRVSI